MQHVTGKPELIKKMNLALIYEALIKLRTATRAEICEVTRLSAAAVRSLTEELLDSGEIIAIALDQSSGGRRAQRYTLSGERNLILSLFLEENRIEYKVCTLVGDTVAEGSEISKEENTSLAFKRFVERCLKKWPICAIGLGVPGIVENGRYYMCSDSSSVFSNNLGEELRELFHIPVILENDLNAIALGYTIQYAEENKKLDMKQMNTAYIHFNKNGIRAGIISGGQIVHGSKHFAGEISFLPITQDKNVGDALRAAADPYKFADTAARLIAIINCITNPSMVIIGGSRFESQWIGLELVKALAKKYICETVMPEIIFSNQYKGNHMKGLTYLTIQNILPYLPISRKTEKRHELLSS